MSPARPVPEHPGRPRRTAAVHLALALALVVPLRAAGGEAETHQLIEGKVTVEVVRPPPTPEPVARALEAAESLRFHVDRAEPLSSSMPALEALARCLAAHPEVALRIEAHTDDQGTEARNLALSQARAAWVRGWLTGRGVAASRLVSLGFGASRPVASNHSAGGRQRNRRVDFVLLAAAGE